MGYRRRTVEEERRSALGSEVQIFTGLSEQSRHFIYADLQSSGMKLMGMPRTRNAAKINAD